MVGLKSWSAASPAALAPGLADADGSLSRLTASSTENLDGGSSG
jgi:hypothetical protein